MGLGCGMKRWMVLQWWERGNGGQGWKEGEYKVETAWEGRVRGWSWIGGEGRGTGMGKGNREKEEGRSTFRWRLEKEEEIMGVEVERVCEGRTVTRIRS